MSIGHPFYFLRHGETTWNAAGRTQGQLDAPLSDLGKRQAAAAAEALKGEPIKRIVASPLSRARDTALAVGAALGLEPSYDEELMEFHAGEWQGEYMSEMIRPYFLGEISPEGGESFEEFAERAWRALRRAAAAGPETLIVCHGGLWYAMQRYQEIAPRMIPMPNAAPIRVEPGAGVWSARLLEE